MKQDCMDQIKSEVCSTVTGLCVLFVSTIFNEGAYLINYNRNKSKRFI